MVEYNFRWLCDQSKKWRQQASDLDFLGEVALPQAELESLLTCLGRFHRRIDERDPAFALAVAAVNWAYWRDVEDEEQRGFRHSFMTHSLGYPDLKLWDSVWGPAIERTICDWCNQPPRLGVSYRYVGLILRHAGVPHAKIPKLAQLLQDLDRNIGWPHLAGARDSEIQPLVTSHFGGGCIADHLSSESGLAYLRSLCADLLFVRSRHPNHAPDLPGYRPGLLSALLESLGSGPHVAEAQPVKLPFVAFDARDGRLEIVFDDRMVRDRRIHCDQWQRPLFDSRLTIGPGGIEPHPDYSGRVSLGRPWSIKGWRYTDPNAWALFRQDGKLVTTHSHEDPVSIGEYLLAAVPTIRIDTLEFNADDGGDQYLPNGTECRIWHLVLQEGDTGKLPNLHVSTSVNPWLSCRNGTSITRWTAFDAVCGADPVVEVGGWTGRNSRRYYLTLTTASGQCDLKPSVDRDGRATVTLSQLREGEEAELSLIPIGYQHGLRTPQTVRVIRFSGSLEPQDGLWAFTKEAEVWVNMKPGLRLEADQPIRIEGTENRVKLLVPPEFHWASIRAVNANASIPLKIPVRRCSFAFSDAPVLPAIFDRALVKRMCAADSSCRSFTISAIPNGTIELVARDHDGLSRQWRRGLRLGSNGRLELPAAELIDVIRNDRGVFRIVVNCSGIEVDTGAIFVDPTESHLETGSGCTGVDKYLQLLRQPLDDLKCLEAIAEVPCLSTYATIVARVDHGLGLSSVSPYSRAVPSDVKSWVDPFLELLAEPPQLPGQAVQAWKDRMLSSLRSAPVPLAPRRWEASVNARIAEIERRLNISDTLSRLLAGVADPLLPDGLVNGWASYIEAAHHRDNDTLFIHAIRYFSHASRGVMPWSGVAQRLSAWALLRAGAIPSFQGAVTDFSPLEECRDLDTEMRTVSALLALEPLTYLATERRGLVLSSCADDQVLASAIATSSQSWPIANEESWLYAWLRWRHSVIVAAPRPQQETLRALAKERTAIIPRRAREIVINELESGRPCPVPRNGI